MYCCLSLLVLQGFLLLIVVENQNIANGQETITSIECEVQYIEFWDRDYSSLSWSYLDNEETGIKCNVQCSPRCTCTLDDVKVTRNCTSDSATVYPVIYPSDNIRYLNWDNSVLHQIKPGTFWRIGRALQGLRLTNVSLLHLQPGVFSGLSGVTDLHLSLNQLQNISIGAFRELENLTRLELDRNILTQITVSAFRGLVRLEELDLSNNRLNRITGDAFEDLVELRELRMNDNYLSEINDGVFRGLIRLEELYLYNNRLNRITERAFEDLVELKELSLNDNNLSEISVGVFRGFIRLRYLTVFNNRLNGIAEDAFEDLVELQQLYLGKNSLSEINLGIFRGLIRLEELDLYNNRLNTIIEGAFKDLVQLQRLRLNDNNLSEINAGVFRGLIRLDQLELDSNRLNRIAEGAFEDLEELKKLYLNDNNLSEINVGVFRGLIRLQALYLYSNKLSRIAEGAFADQGQLMFLRLHDNILSDIDVGVFRELTRLKFSTIDNNRLNRIDEDAFEDLVELQHLYLNDNNLSKINVGVFRGLKRLLYLRLTKNSLTGIAEGAFKDLAQLRGLWLNENNLLGISVGVLRGLIRLKELYLGSNSLNRIAGGAFEDLVELQSLHLNDNRLSEINVGVFRGLMRLYDLFLGNNDLNKIAEGAFEDLGQLQKLSLIGNPLLWIEKHALDGLNEKLRLFVTDYATCCFTSAVCEHQMPPQSPYLTCKRLLPYDLLRIAMWFVCSFAIFGNLFVFCTRCGNKPRRNIVQFLLIMNLSISDFLMGIYLIIILSTDLYYTEYFPLHSELWRHSMLCRVAGAISVLSSEASTFFITLITIDRFLGIKYTFSKFRLGSISTPIIVTVLWITALSISVVVFILSKEDSEIYAASEICVGLPISRTPNHMKVELIVKENPPRADNALLVYKIVKYVKSSSSVGMFFSIALFTGLNLVCFFIVGYCYVAIFIYVRQTTKQSGRSRNLNDEFRMTVKMSLIVFTDFCCWVPIGLLSILAQTGVVEVNPAAYAWIATFMLPINSSLNPFLYTLASCLSEKVKCTARKEASKGKTATERIPMRATSDSS